MTSAVHEAAKNGDRSENGDYIYGKRRLREIDSRVRFLNKRLDELEVVTQALQARSQPHHQLEAADAPAWAHEAYAWRLLEIDDEDLHDDALALEQVQLAFDMDAAQALQASTLNYVGFIEGSDLFAGKADVVVTDVKMPDDDGLVLLEELADTHPELPVIVVTAYSDLDSAVAATHRTHAQIGDIARSAEMLTETTETSTRSVDELGETGGDRVDLAHRIETLKTPLGLRFMMRRMPPIERSRGMPMLVPSDSVRSLP